MSEMAEKAPPDVQRLIARAAKLCEKYGIVRESRWRRRDVPWLIRVRIDNVHTDTIEWSGSGNVGRDGIADFLIWYEPDPEAT